MKKIVPMLAIFCTVFFWGSSFPAMSFLLETSSPFILAAGRFSSIFLSKIEGEQTAIDFFKNCINTQKNFEKSRDSSNIT